jgi:peptidoglycan hydrolase-like protein with peptidoglycan-binding domain
MDTRRRLRDDLGKVMTSIQIARAQELSATLNRRTARGESIPVARPLAPASATGPSRAMVTEAQKSLGLLGYNPGPADGLPGRRTANAVKAFQSDLKMTPTDGISDDLLMLLKITVAVDALVFSKSEA